MTFDEFHLDFGWRALALSDPLVAPGVTEAATGAAIAAVSNSEPSSTAPKAARLMSNPTVRVGERGRQCQTYRRT